MSNITPLVMQQSSKRAIVLHQGSLEGIALERFLLKKPKVKPNFCGECISYNPHNWASRCKIGHNTGARAGSRACKSAIPIAEAKRSF